MFNPDDTAENLKKNGGFIPGIRPGSNTAAYLRRIIFRPGAVGALYLTLVSLLPEILRAEYPVPFYFGGPSLRIVVTTVRESVGQTQPHLLGARIRSRDNKLTQQGRRGEYL